MAIDLSPGQYQIGNLIFGKGTMLPVEDVEIQPYEVKNQDFQVPQSDEFRFGRDSFVPASIIFTMGVLRNYTMPGFTPQQYDNTWLYDLQKEWRGDDVRSIWGELKPLYYCDYDNVTQIVFGRPRKFQYSKRRKKTDFTKVVAEFKCVDTLSYSAEETVQNMPCTVTRTLGSASSWVRFLLYGPMNNPIISFGSQNIQLNYQLGGGEVVEISSYPWSRRVVNSNGNNLIAKLASPPYLDQIKLGIESRSVSWSGGGSAQICWRDAYHGIT